MRLLLTQLRRLAKDALLVARGIVCRPWVAPSQAPPPLKEYRTLVVLRTDRLGDVVLTYPLVQSLKRHAPRARVLYAVPQRWASLFESQRDCDGVIALTGGFRKQARALSRQSPDLIVDAQTDSLSFPAQLCRASGTPWRVGFSGFGRERFLNCYRSRPAASLHFSQQVLSLLDLWPGIEREAIQTPFLRPPVDDSGWWMRVAGSQERDPRRWVFIHPGGFHSSQRWPLERFQRLAERIVNQLGAAVVWCWGEEFSSRERLKTVAKPVVELRGLSVAELALALSRSSLFVGNNSGPLHLASALGVPTVSTMGPTVPHLWWPLGARNRVVRLGVACSPCPLVACGHHTCLKAIGVDRVFQEVRHQLMSLQEREG